MTLLAQTNLAGYTFKKEVMPGGRVIEGSLNFAIDLGSKKTFPTNMQLLSRAWATHQEDPEWEEKFKVVQLCIGTIQLLRNKFKG